MVALETTPVIVIVCPTCGASFTLSLLTSQVPPSFVVKLYSLASSAFWRQPVRVLVFLWVVFVSSCATVSLTVPVNIKNINTLIAILTFIFTLQLVDHTSLKTDYGRAC